MRAQAQLLIYSTTPAAHQVGVARNTNVAAAFSYTLGNNATTQGATKVFSQQAGGLRSGVTTVNSNTLTFNPDADFKAGERVSATFTKAIKRETGENLVIPRVLQFITATSPSTGTFSGGSDVTVNGAVNRITTGDVDGDGDLDLVVPAVNGTTTSVAVRLNNGNGTYTTGQELDGARTATLADLDGDSDLDLLTSSSSGSGVLVYLNSGNGTFTFLQTVTVLEGLTNIGVGDLDADGDLDLITTAYGIRPGTTSIRLNNGSGSFGGGQDVTYTPNVERTFNVAVGDLDGDGDLDFITGNSSGNPSSPQANSITLYNNNGSGTFTVGQFTILGTGNGVTDVVLGDLDKDGDLDFVSTNGGSSQAVVGLNSGNGTFSTRQFAGPSNLGSLALGDVDGDGDLDFTTSTAGGTLVWLNNGAALFSTPQTIAAIGGTTLSDVDGDGDLDLLGISGTNTVGIRLNQNLLTPPLAITSFAPARNTVAAARTTDVAVTFNQALSNTATTQGALKVYSAQAGGQKAGAVTVSGSTLALNPATDFKAGETVFASVLTAAQSSNGQGLAQSQVFQFTAATAPSTGTFSGGSDIPVSTGVGQSVTGDVNGDGNLDLLTAGSFAVSIQLGQGNGTFTSGQQLNGVSGAVIKLGDVDGDGDLDLLSTPTGALVRVFRNNGSGTFTAATEVAVPDGITDLALGDIDGDGDLDLLTTANGIRPGSLGVRFNDGSGVFSTGQNITTGVERTLRLALGDLDGDGDLDVITSNIFTSTVTIYTNAGAGVFDSGTVITVGNGGQNFGDVVLGDFDKDGDLDFLATRADLPAFTIGLNNGAGAFTLKSQTTMLPLGTVKAGDVDGDGDLDFVGQTTAGTTAWLNNGTATFSSGSPALAVQGPFLGDVDNDGDLDLLGTTGAGSAGANLLNVRLNQNTASDLRNPENPANAVAGLDYKYYEGYWTTLPAFNTLTPTKTGTLAGPELTPASRDNGYAFQYTGYVTVPTDGQYTFYTSSDDGSRLYIGSQLVVDNDGLHGEQERSGTIGLKAGTHALTIAFFENDGGQTLNVSYAGPSLGKQLIPATAYKRVSTTANQAPVANAGANQSLTLPTSVATLNGSASSDADGTVASYQWAQVSGPNTATFSNPTVAQPTVSNLVAGTYVFSLVVKDNLGLASAAAQTTVTVNAASDLRTPENPTNTVAGLDYKYYEGFWDAVPDYRTLTPLKTGTTTAFELSAQQRDYAFSFQFTGYVTVPTDGQYTFYTNSDDGSLLYIGNTLVVNNDGSHGDRELSGTIGLKAGTHAFTVSYLQGYGGQNLQVSYAGPSLGKQLLPASALKRVSGPASNLRVPENPANAVAGLDYKYYEGYWNALPTFSALTPAKTGTVTSPVLTPALRDDGYAFQYTGYVTVPTDGQYTFYTTSDDGSKLYIGSQLVVDNDGLHGDVEQAGTIGLQAGTHAVTITFFENDGGQTLNVSYAGPSLSKQLIPAAAYKRVSGQPANNLRVPENPTGTVAGLDYQYYEGFWDVLPNFASLTPLQRGANSVIDLAARQRDYGYAFQYTGYVTVPADGQYTFSTSSDDGSKLYIGSTLVVDNDGSHDTQERSGTIGLQAGTHAFTVTYFQNGGGQVFSASFQGPGLAKQLIPASALRRVPVATKSGATTATSQGLVAARAGRNLLEVYPNPLTESGTVHFRTRQAGKAQVYLYNELGKLIATVYDAEVASGGEYYLPLSTEKLASGVYLCRLISNGQVENLRLTVVR